MLEKTNSRIFTFLLGLSAFAVATAAAIFSITGLSMLYSGSMLYVAIAMSALEFAKIITASYLYRYWKSTGFGLKTYLTIAVLVLMIVTSGGIYGYLTNSYQGATVGLDKINSQSQVLDQRKENLTAERGRLVGDIATLRAERQSTIGNRNDEIGVNNLATDSTSMKYRNYRNSQVYKRYNEELTRIDNSISQYTTQLDSTNVRLSRANNDISDKKLEMIDTGVDVGPLVYMARIFNTSMDTVMKWFTLVIVLVFDPLAIALIVALNVVLAKDRKIEVSPIVEMVDSDETFDLGEPDDLSFMKTAKPIKEAFDDIQEKIDKKKEKEFLQEIDDEIEEMEKEVEKKRPRFSQPNPKKETISEYPIEKAAESFDNLIHTEKVVDLVEPLNEIVEDIKDEPTKDIVVPLESESGSESMKLWVETQPMTKPTDVEFKLDFEERVVQEPAKSGDIPKEKIIEAVKSVREKQIERQNEFFDKMHEEKDEREFEEERKSKKKSPVTSDEIRDYFEDAVRKVKKDGQGIITTTPFQAGGSVSVDHLQDDPDIDYSIQE